MIYSGRWVPTGRFPNKLAHNAPDNMLRKPPSCYFTSFLIVSLTAFVNKLRESHFLRDLIIFMITSISSCKIINVAIPDTIFFWIATSVADAAAFNYFGIKNVLSIFFIKGKPVFSNGPRSLPKNPPDCLILCNWVFGNFILADKLFVKALRKLYTCVLANDNDNLCGNLVSSFWLFDERFKVTLVPFFILDFDFF